MIKNIAIVSLSSGTLGEDFAKHEVNIGINLPIVYNINIGHAQPRCIIPFGVEATVDIENQVIRFAN